MYVLNHIHVGPTFNGPSLCTRGGYEMSGNSPPGGPTGPHAPTKPTKKPKKPKK